MTPQINSNIYIIGYPKSGNTWLSRLVARCANMKVEAYPTGPEHKDLAADVNKYIRAKTDKKIFKIHYRPDDFFAKYQFHESDYIIYVIRNPLDVIMSGFFYFRYNNDPEVISLATTLKYFYSFSYIVKRMRARRALSNWIYDFCNNGLPYFGTWEQHVSEWKSQFESKTICKASVTSYERLRSNTIVELGSVFSRMGIEFTQSHLRNAVINEGFEKRKQELYSERNKGLTGGSGYNIRFLRSGEIQGYRKYLTKHQINNLLWLDQTYESFVKNMLSD